MVVPLSKLEQTVVVGVVQAVEQARARLIGQHRIQTLPPEVNFTVEVVIDTLDRIEMDITESVSPDQVTTTTKGAESSTSTQSAATTTETQITTPGAERTEQAFGRSTEIVVEETN